MKRISESSVRGWRPDKKKGAALSHAQLASMRRIGRPPLGEEPRKLIAIRLDPKVL